MNFSNVSTKHLTEATDFLTAELSSVIRDGRAPDSRTAMIDFLGAFIDKQRQQNIRGYALLANVRFEAAKYMALTPACSELSPFFKTWLSCQLSRTLLLACGCYHTDSPERDMHWSYYKPLLAAVQELDRPGGNGAPDSLYTWSDAFTTIPPVYSPN